MFEKDAEKYRGALELIYKNGVLDGYNKANEWHWAKKEGFPKDNKAYLTLMSYGIRGTKYEVRENLKDEQPYNLVKWKDIK